MVKIKRGYGGVGHPQDAGDGVYQPPSGRGDAGYQQGLGAGGNQSNLAGHSDGSHPQGAGVTLLKVLISWIYLVLK